MIPGRARFRRLLASWVALGAVALVAVAAGCGGDRDSNGTPHSIVLYVIDTLRADRLGVYGHDRPTSPNLDALAREGVVFDRAYAPAPWTLPSVVSILTSLPPCEHGVLVDERRLGTEVVPWAERLRASGYETASFHANPYAGEMSGLDRGFERSELVPRIDGELVSDWLSQRSGRPFFLYLHSVEPHDPYELPHAPGVAEVVSDASVARRRQVNAMLARYRKLTRADWSAGRPPGTSDTNPAQLRGRRALERVRDEALELYDAEILLADHYLGSVLRALDEAGLRDRVVVAVTSDHGEEFGEHGGWQHDQSLYDELVRVPLVLRWPGAQRPGAREPGAVSLLDLVPTLAGLAGATDALGGPGGSWSGWLTGEAERPPQPVFAGRENLKKQHAPFDPPRGDHNVAFVDGTWKAIWNADPGTLELYDLEADPGEQVDRSAGQPARAARAEAAARQWSSDCRARAREGAQSAPVDEAARDRLRALGYLD
jgi:arylsulfatase A-like enzyme